MMQTKSIPPSVRKDSSERARRITSLRGAKEIKQFLMLPFLGHSLDRNGTLHANIKVAVSSLIVDSVPKVITSFDGVRN